MSTLTDFSNGLAAAVEKGGTGTVLVDARKRYPASGIAYAADLVLTADHVVTRDEDLRIVTADGKAVSVTLAGRDPGSDLALLRLAEKVLSPAKVADASAKIGQLVLALGRPDQSGVQASWGIIAAIGGPARTGRGGLLDEYIQTETTSYPGFSGGPLVNTEGEVLGLNTSGLTHGSSLTVPVKFAWRIAGALDKHGAVKRGYLGVRTQSVDIPDAARTALKREQQHGLLVLWLEEKGPAEQGGLMVGDILVAIGGQPVGEPDDLFAALNTDTVGKTIAVEVLRGGRPETVKVTVGERK
ncbi:MAG: trypsin-like peptidase domain-containing protein [Chloroflexi bacterium]|nr:trypsin-like peptidase domain-containing protein [Chloroflexota bacterium]MBI3339626.1 trypsin-like peptidase domain-containing protein [Chloroflexota bacterium]